MRYQAAQAATATADSSRPPPACNGTAAKRGARVHDLRRSFGGLHCT